SPEQPPYVLDRAHAAAHGQGQEHPVGRACDHLQDGVALVGRSGDVEKGQLVGALVVVSGRALDRIAGVAQLDEAHALDHAAAIDVEARDNALGEHARSVAYWRAAVMASGSVKLPS